MELGVQPQTLGSELSQSHWRPSDRALRMTGCVSRYLEWVALAEAQRWDLPTSKSSRRKLKPRKVEGKATPGAVDVFRFFRCWNPWNGVPPIFAR